MQNGRTRDTKLDILRGAQHRFLKKRPRESQLISMVHDLTQDIEDRKQLDVISCWIVQMPLIEGVTDAWTRRYSIRGISNFLTLNFIGNTEQKLLLNGKFSEAVNSGIPQVMVLGPMLFLIFIQTFRNMSRRHQSGCLQMTAYSTMPSLITATDLDQFRIGSRHG